MKLKGLMKKDLLVIWLQVKMPLLVSLLFVVLSAFTKNNFMLGFALLFVAVLPNSVLAYDEQSRWDLYALAIRYGRKELVVSKYLLMLLLLLCYVVCYVLLSVLFSAVSGSFSMGSDAALICRFAGLGMLYAAIVMPFSFALGVNKARLINLLVIGCMAGGITSANLNHGFDEMNIMDTSPFLGIPFLIFVAVLFCGSLFLAVKLYEKRKL